MESIWCVRLFPAVLLFFQFFFSSSRIYINYSINCKGEWKYKKNGVEKKKREDEKRNGTE